MDDQLPQTPATVVARYPGWCSFCRKSYQVAGPLVEGPDNVYICYKCLKLCEAVFVAEYERKGIPLPQ